MMLFDGERKKDGSINWINPKPTKKQLTTVDILSLNFYPPNYLDTLNKWGYNSKDKTFTDSLYYSFICNSNSSWTTKYAKDSTLDEKLGAKKKDRGPAPIFSKSNSNSVDAKGLFKQNCAVCHTMTDKKLTGPGLAGVKNRVPKGNWLFE